MITPNAHGPNYDPFQSEGSLRMPVENLGRMMGMEDVASQPAVEEVRSDAEDVEPELLEMNENLSIALQDLHSVSTISGISTEDDDDNVDGSSTVHKLPSVTSIADSDEGVAYSNPTGGNDGDSNPVESASVKDTDNPVSNPTGGNDEDSNPVEDASVKDIDNPVNSNVTSVDSGHNGDDESPALVAAEPVSVESHNIIKDVAAGVGVGAAGAGIAAAGTVAGNAAIMAGANAIGFTATGIAAESIAAGMMSTAAIANGGGVAAGTTVAVLQSVGTGATVLLSAGIWVPVGAVVGIGLWFLKGHLDARQRREKEQVHVVVA